MILSDAILELRISIATKRLIAGKTKAYRAHQVMWLAELVARRSPQRVERMERAKGLR